MDISGLQEKVPQFYTYRHNGHDINFFVVRIDGRIVSFLDACRKCYPRKRGFRFDQSSFICRACDERYPISEIDKGFGSCYPIQLQGRTDGGKYYISVPVLEKTAMKYFS
ncbi:MAG TPA: Fe-S-containing protein [Thermodesulfovibrionales bacterium]|nr:Fe-S-containing protein [Thermodesulfovibrionales bacterium]